MSNIPRWKCHKEVNAFKIGQIDYSTKDKTGYATLTNDDGSIIAQVNSYYLEKHKPELNGYYVLYDDGYQSFSPAKAFEDGYTEIK